LCLFVLGPMAIAWNLSGWKNPGKFHLWRLWKYLWKFT
jgi:hypothetical protein